VIPEADRRAVATALAAAERDRAPIGPPSRKWPRLDAVDAYEIQLINARERLAAGGVVRGHKVGLTSRAMQQMLGVREPDYGQLGLPETYAAHRGCNPLAVHAIPVAGKPRQDEV